MSPLQTALLIVGVLAVIAIYIFSRRERNTDSLDAEPIELKPAVKSKAKDVDQIDLFARDSDYDEYGVSRPRKRSEPSLGAPSASGATTTEPALTPAAMKPAPAFLAPTSIPTRVPSFVAAAPKPEPALEHKIITILIAERAGQKIEGPRLHAALQAQGLSYGDRKIYHRLENGRALYSVAGLLKPGHLDPDEAAQFSTPGVSMFMLLPGPTDPVAALHSMLSTAKALAAALNADLFDAKRLALSAETEAQMLADVQGWAQRRA